MAHPNAGERQAQPGRPGSLLLKALSAFGHPRKWVPAAVLAVAADYISVLTTKDVGLGTGLGLASAYGIAKQDKGWIEVESQPGRGSVFQVFLPAAEGAPPAPSDDTATGVIMPRGTETILLVEPLDPSTGGSSDNPWAASDLCV